MTGEEIETLTALSRSSTERASRVSRAAMLLGYREKPSFFAVGRRLGVFIRRSSPAPAAVADGVPFCPDATSTGKEPTIAPEPRLACVAGVRQAGHCIRTVVDDAAVGRHAREHGPAAGLTVSPTGAGHSAQILVLHETNPHKVRYYLERRDADSEHQKAELCVAIARYRYLKKAGAKAEKSKKSEKPVAIVSFDEKPGMPAIATTARIRRCRACIRPSRGIMSTNAMARSACWPGLICSAERSTRWSRSPPQP